MDSAGKRVCIEGLCLSICICPIYLTRLLLPLDETSLKNTQLKVGYTDLEFPDSSETVPCFHFLPSAILLLLITFGFLYF